MQWSKLKARLSSFICLKLMGRIDIHATVYRKFHDRPSRVWITLDKEEIFNASDIRYALEHEKLYIQLKKENKLATITYHPNWKMMFDSPERKDLVDASNRAEQLMIEQSIFESFHLYEAFIKYCSLSMEEALTSEDIIIQAFSMFDRRLGKRRLEKLSISEETHPLMRQFYRIRCEVEGIKF
ncbi:nonribosomal peptide synthetase [Pseudogracilibacillus auburnensis]|nr:nonribosomal peptide synthetase [Pseudogracilibacillus auburnensis]